MIKIGSISTSEIEIKALLKAWIAISFAFAVVLNSGRLSGGFYSKFVIASLTVGVGFLLHELGHKVVAQRYGCFAEFRSFDQMLLLAIIMSFFGFVFAAPGAVMIAGKISKRKNGLISAAGPIVNIALSLLFMGLLFFPLPNLFKAVAVYGFMINSWLALFNMLPFWLFDGNKIWKWSKPAYFAVGGTALSLMILQNFAFR